MRSPLAVVLVLAACAEPKITDTPRSKPPTTCTTTAEHVVDELVAGKDPRPPDDVVNKYIALLRTRCETDGWTLEAQNCLSTMASAADADRCGTLLTPAQQEALVRDQRALDAKPAEKPQAEPDGAANAAPPAQGAPPPPPKIDGSTRGRDKGAAPSGPKPPEDPCAGGE